jgi:hypothetical protein
MGSSSSEDEDIVAVGPTNDVNRVCQRVLRRLLDKIEDEVGVGDEGASCSCNVLSISMYCCKVGSTILSWRQASAALCSCLR